MDRMSGSGTALLLLAFAAAVVATWMAGVYLSRSTDALDDWLRLGQAVGGMVFLAIAGSLPELAITISAARAGNLGLASGNLIGGIAVLGNRYAPRSAMISLLFGLSACARAAMTKLRSRSPRIQ